MSTDYVCEYCNTHITTSYNLKKHQSKAVYCLKIQGKAASATKYTCKGCSKSYNQKASYKSHTKGCYKYKSKKRIKKYKTRLNNCKQRLFEKEEEFQRIIRAKDLKYLKAKELLKSKDEEIRKYEQLYANNEGKVEVYKDVATKPRTVNNTVNQINPKLTNIPISNIQPFTIENVRKRIENGEYTYEMFIAGVQGITKFVSAMIVRDGVVEEVDGIDGDGQDGDDTDLPQERNYVCTDSSRNRFHRLLSSKDWKSDNGAHFLEKVLSELEPKANEYYLQIIDMMTNAKTEDDREHTSKIQELTKDIYFGITRPNARERKQLFKKLRSEIKSIAAV